MWRATVFAPWWHQCFPRGITAGTDALVHHACEDHDVRATVLIVDDHEDFRQSAAALLESEGFAVVGGAADGVAAIDAIERLRPEVVLLDIQLPDVDGFTIAERLAALPDPPTVVLISGREASAYGARLEATPARGFISKRQLSGAALAALVG
jgi:DNA-binding NarL/FixJ family response regulator